MQLPIFDKYECLLNLPDKFGKKTSDRKNINLAELAVTNEFASLNELMTCNQILLIFVKQQLYVKPSSE